MSRWFDHLRRHAGFSLGAVALGVAFLVLGWGVHVSRQAMLRAEKRLALLEREWSGLNQSEAVTDEAAVVNLQARVDREVARLATLRTVLRGGETARAWAEAKVPDARTDAYFELAAQVERMRRAAREHAVACHDDEQYGFADYRGAGPEPEHIPVVLRQRQMLDYLLTQLFILGPQRLDRVERSRMPGLAAGGARMATAGRDEFVPDIWTAALPGRGTVTACRIAFTAQTEVLRRWLNRIAEFDAPLVVRLVEVEPLAPPPVNTAGAMDADDDVVLVVPHSLSRFTVTVEYLEPVPPEEAQES